jgi:hypothetical protein
MGRPRYVVLVLYSGGSQKEMPIRKMDKALTFLYVRMLKDQEALPIEEREGFQKYCRRYGILAPEDEASIETFERTETQLTRTDYEYRSPLDEGRTSRHPASH